MEQKKKQIDYDSLEWFDCKNNFPPMSIDLYVDSEHGYGIGRLGRRVKDKSIIWTVHLDSGDVYQVYAFYKVKRWAYMPKDEKTNTKLKYELMMNKERSWVPCYLKSEADKVIAELESDNADLRDDKKTTDAILNERNEEIAELNKQIESLKDKLRHQNYKRCLAMAEYCEACMNQFPFFGAISKEEVWWQKWHDKWYDLADKFKPNSTAQ